MFEFLKLRRYRVNWLDAPFLDQLPDGLLHNHESLLEVKKIYEEHQFDTDVILQSHSHKEPTAAKAVGLPVNWRKYPQLRRWGENVVLRVHVGVYRYLNGFLSQPHLEPCPRWCPVEHMIMVKRRDDVKGKAAIDVLKWLLNNN